MGEICVRSVRIVRVGEEEEFEPFVAWTLQEFAGRRMSFEFMVSRPNAIVGVVKEVRGPVLQLGGGWVGGWVNPKP